MASRRRLGARYVIRQWPGGEWPRANNRQWPGGEWPRANNWQRQMAANWEDESALMEHHKSKEELEEELTSSRNWAGIDRNCEL